MDLNYLFLRQQVERTLSERAATNAAKAAHEGMARKYELEIERETGGRIMNGRPPCMCLAGATSSGARQTAPSWPTAAGAPHRTLGRDSGSIRCRLIRSRMSAQPTFASSLSR